jgi:hypothetical protein
MHRNKVNQTMINMRRVARHRSHSQSSKISRVTETPVPTGIVHKTILF